MKNNVFSRFNVYDQIGYLLVGSVALLLIAFNFEYLYETNFFAFNLKNFIVWLVVAYFLGHVMQGFANIIGKIPLVGFLIKENKTNFDDQQKEVLDQIRDYFSLDQYSDHRVWNICYMFSASKDITGQINQFNGYYSLYRGWTVTFLLQSLFLFYFVLVNFGHFALASFLLSIFILILFRSRSKRFWSYLRNKVLDTFIVLKKIS